MKFYKYGMRLRPASLGCQPKDFKYIQADKSGDYHDFVFYGRKLTDEELSDYEMNYLGVSE